MLRVHYSNRFEALADAIDEVIGPGDPLETAVVLVPNRPVAAYVKLARAARRGIMMGLEFAFLEAFLRERLERARPGPVLDKPTMHVRLVHVLGNADRMSAPELAEVRAYLVPKSGSADERERRGFELARELADLFHEYAMSRPGLIAGWSQRKPLPRAGAAGEERWQRELWLAISDSGRLRPLGDDVLATPPEALGLPPVLHMCGFSFLSRAHHRLLEHLARACELHIYQLNPCREFWDDLRRGPDEAEPDLLSRWGRAGQEQMRALNQLAGWDFDDCFREPDRAGALAALQRSILVRQPSSSAGSAGPAARGDESIRIHACPSARREIEVIAAAIGRHMQGDPELSYSDCAVLLAGPDSELYHGHVAAVFREQQIPHHIIDRALSRDSRVVEAVDLLLDLPGGTFARPELLRLMVHPAVIGAFPDADPDDWVHWTERLGIFHGADASDHQGTYIDKELYHWDQGIRRMAYGAFMAHEPERRAPEVVRAGGRPLVPETISADRLRSAGQFALLARALIREARALRRERMTLAEWGARLAHLAGEYVHASEDFEQGNLERCREALHKLGQSDGEPAPIGFRTAREFARAALAGLPSARGEALADGVMVAPLAAMRPLPFRYIFAAGLGEGGFPRVDRDNPLDLRQSAPPPQGPQGPQAPQSYDVSEAERDRTAFLEVVLSARDGLALTYVDRDLMSGAERTPSPVVAELSHATGARAEVEPLRRPELQRIHAVRREFEARCRAGGVPWPEPAVLRQAVAMHGGPELARLCGAIALPEAPPPLAGARVTLPRLRRFLECPAQAWAGLVVGLSDDDEGSPLAAGDEPFAFERGAEVGWLREVMIDHLLADGAGAGGNERELRQRYAALFDRLELTGQTPTGLFAERARKGHADMLAFWQASAEAWRAARPLRALQFGASEVVPPGVMVQPALVLDLSGVRVEISGRAELASDADFVSLSVAKNRPGSKAFLRGFLSAAVVAAAGLGDGRDFTVTVIGSERVERRRFAGWSEAEARAYLGALCGALVALPHDYLLPCEAVFERHKAPDRSLAEIAARYQSGDTPCSSSFGPIKRLAELRVLPEPEWLAVVAERWSRFLAGAEGA